MADVVSIDVARVRAAARSLQASAEGSSGLVWQVGQCRFGNGLGDPGRERAIREGYLRLARAIGAFSTGSSALARGLAETVDAYDARDTANAGNAADVVSLGAL
ncbi:N-acyl-D-amino-acid deacylase [Rhodococcus hoagii]|nr:N-acyl-D-amino-acid deacylase [Prescottella equi]NKS74172.1 N-acyl-D-amino-acid deacylase [Prescottella equi]NKZ89990.1 N-acyl-D-amino-acid deacylase [Prescottella equi]